MSNWRLVRLNFGRNPTHFGEVGIGLERTSERVRSDTLFSAWASAYARIYGKEGIETLLEQFNQHPENPPFRLSSTFIYHRQDDDLIDYLPKLITRPIGYPDNDLAFAKAYRKLDYLPLAVWQRWYQGDGFQASQDADELITYRTNYKQAFKSYELPKVSIDRTTRATNFYHTGLVQFAWNPIAPSTSPSDPTINPWHSVHNLAGLYFLIHFAEEEKELEAELRSALDLLGEEGLGGERSSGAGRFQVINWQALAEIPQRWQSVLTFDPTKDTKETKETKPQHGLISLFWPEGFSAADLDPGDRYTIQERGGWIFSPSGRQLRRQKIHMFMEGSVFTHPPKGNLADVTPKEFGYSPEGKRIPHSIYRSGIALSLPVNLRKEA